VTAHEVLLVPHTHWDREWHHEFQQFRARLVDTVDRVLELLAADPGYVFHLDGQSVVVEDYLAVRPHRRAELAAACGSGRLAVGPWWVQPDSLLPSGESHVRNLLEGRRAAALVGASSRVAYVPDSFGHPAQFPQLFAGFGLGPFVFWRGNGDELDRLPTVWEWVGADGTSVTAYHLAESYSAAATLDDQPLADVVARLTALGETLAARTPAGMPLVFPNGTDHMLPDAGTGEVAAALSEHTGWQVTRALLDRLVGLAPPGEARHHGELLGGRTANLLPGVWSARLPLKLWARRCEALLEGWAEPAAALGLALGATDERPALRLAWRALLQNTAHDSIGGCSTDAVHEQMLGRYAEAEGLAQESTDRLLERLAGCATARRTPWSTSFDLAVWNPSPFPRTDVVRFPLEPYPFLRTGFGGGDLHPWYAAAFAPAGGLVEGRPARLVASDDPARFRLLPEHRPFDLELVVDDVPAGGWRRVHVSAGAVPDDEVDDGRHVRAGRVTVDAAADGTLTVDLGAGPVGGLLALEDVGDRGDTYDADLLADGHRCRRREVLVTRRRSAVGIAELVVLHTLELPVGLAEPARQERLDATTVVTVEVLARVAPGVDRVDLRVRVDGAARDHRLRLLVPTGVPVASFRAATTSGTARRVPGAGPAAGWKHPPPVTFPQQGWVEVGPLVVLAPGLPEAEVLADGTLALTLLRSVGWLSRAGLASRAEAAGPGMPVAGAQCPGRLEARLALLPADSADPSDRARAAELGLRAVLAGDAPLWPAGEPLVSIGPPPLVCSALKPADEGDGLVVRVLNPSAEPVEALVRFGFGVAEARPVRLDETPDAAPLRVQDGTVRLTVPPSALRSVLVTPAARRVIAVAGEAGPIPAGRTRTAPRRGSND